MNLAVFELTVSYLYTDAEDLVEITEMVNQCNGDYDEILPGRYIRKDVTSLLCHNRLTGMYHQSSVLKHLCFSMDLLFYLLFYFPLQETDIPQVI